MFCVQTGSYDAARDSRGFLYCATRRTRAASHLGCTGGFSKDESHSIYDHVPDKDVHLVLGAGLTATGVGDPHLRIG